MLNTCRLFCFIGLLAGHSLATQAPSLDQEFNDILWNTARHIDYYYIEKVSPDTLFQAGARGLFRALDPDSDYTLSSGDTGLTQHFTTLLQIARTIDANALYPVGADTLIRFGLAGMLETLDPYTVFMEKRYLDSFNIHTKGHYGGLGFKIQTVYPDSAIAVWSLLHSDTPAARAGVKSGDLIIAIDDSSTKYMSVGDAADLMRGEPGTSVTLTLERAGASQPIKKTITRERVQMNSVAYHTLFPDSTGYIKLTGFQYKKSSQEVRQALTGLLSREVKRLIFDLRGNSGGYLQEAVEIVDLFLPKDRLVVFTAGRAYPDTVWHITKEDALIGDTPLVVLVDHESASASEIVAGAVQDWDRGLVLGMPTVGKGSVQQPFRIGDKAELKLTIAAYFTPSGRSIDKRMRKDSTLVDSPDKPYYTQTLGRIVHGGGGITPDVHMEGRKATPLYYQLRGWRRSKDARFFHFTRQQPVLHPDLKPDFRADQKTLRAFRKFVEERGFEYISEAEAHLDELEKIAHQDEYKKLEKTVNRLKKEIDKVEEQHWKDNEELILWKLTFDILEKVHGTTAAEAYNATVDPVLARARAILADPQAYEEWFKKPKIGLQEDQTATDSP